MRIKILLLAAVAGALLLGLACQEETLNQPFSQADWTREGWKLWKVGNYEDAETAFGNALKVDPYYAEAYGGLGWTFIRMQNQEDAVNQFENGILVGEQAGTSLFTRQILYMGAAVAYEATDEYTLSAEKGRYMANNLLTHEFNFYDHTVTTYDLYIILSLDYYGLADSTNCVWAINKMRAAVGEQPNYHFTTWEDATREIERLVGKDPS